MFAETCPQYLYLTLEDQLGAPGFEGAKWVCSTPLRSKHEPHARDLWKGLRSNDLAIVSTDHCPFCMKDQKELGRGDFSKIPNGIGGVEHRVDLIYQGVVDGQLSLERWVETIATTPARMFGLYPQKGIVQPGSDADLVIYDPNGTTRIGVETHHMNMDHSAYEGVEIKGRVGTVDLARRGDRGRRQLPWPEGPRAVPASAACRRTWSDKGEPVDFGVVFQCDPPASAVVELRGKAEDAGFVYVWTFDSHLLWQEPFVIYSQILAATRPRDRRADGDESGDPRLDRDRVPVRHPERDVRQPHGLRDRPRRLGVADARREAGNDRRDEAVRRGGRGRWRAARRSSTAGSS